MTDDDRAIPDPPLSKSAYALKRLRQDFANGTITPGEALRQGEIANRYGVSATPVREALRILEADGLIVYSPHRGATVAEMARPDLHDLYLLRANVEAFTTSLAVERGTAEQIAELRKKHDDLVARAFELSPEELSRRNRDFHLSVMTVGSAYVASQVIRPLWERSIPPSLSLWQRPDQVRRFLDEHEAIVSAMERGDADLAGRQMAHHITSAGSLREAKAN